MAQSRREFLLATVTTGMLELSPMSKLWARPVSKSSSIPSYLFGHKAAYAKDPHQAAIDWFRQAKFGLFMHYGLYSLLGRDAWVQYEKKIPVKEYEKLKSRFTAANFDADFITNTALKAGMKYVNLTTRHHDGFCLFKTSTTDFNSYDSPAKRDLVGELAEACARKELGLCLYYSHGRDWRDPDAPNNDEWGGDARPKYPTPDPTYHTGGAHDLNRYIQHINTHMRELLTNYGPVASIWFDGYSVPASGDVSKFHLPETYALIRSLQRQCLISYKLAPTGLEDYYAPEMGWIKDESQKQKVEEMLHSDKPREICTSMSHGWGYVATNDGKHFPESAIWDDLEFAARLDANLLLNSGLRPDGSMDSQDVQTLLQIGNRIRTSGFPSAPAARA